MRVSSHYSLPFHNVEEPPPAFLRLDDRESTGSKHRPIHRSKLRFDGNLRLVCTQISLALSSAFIMHSGWNFLSSERPGQAYQDQLALSSAISSDATETLPSTTSVSFADFVAPDPVSLQMAAAPLEKMKVDAPIVYRARKGDTIEKVLARYRATKQTISEFARSSLLSVANHGALKAGDLLELVRCSRTKDIIGLRKYQQDGVYILASRTPAGTFSFSTIEQGRTAVERRESGVINGSFSQSAKAADLPLTVIDDFVDLFSERIDFRKDLHTGDSFSVVFEERRSSEGMLIGSGPILAASLRVDGAMLVAVRHVGKDGKARYFDEKGAPQGGSFLRYPLKFSRISSVFSDSRLHPVLKVKRPHNGVDFAAPTGTPVRSIGPGTIIFSGPAGGSGNMVKIQHDARYVTAYLHLSKISKEIKKGVRIDSGALIGAVGATGLASGPHLHFSLYDRGRYTDPLKSNFALALVKENLIPPQYLASRLDLLRRGHDSQALASNRAGTPKKTVS